MYKNKYLSIFYGILALLIPLNAEANLKDGLYIAPSLHYTSSSETDYDNNKNEVTINKKTFILNLDINYVWSNSLMIGIKYYSESLRSNELDSSNELETTTSSTGLNLGYIAGNILMNLGLMFISNPTEENEIYQKFEGSGLIFDLFYTIKIGNWFLGPQLTYLQTSYKTLKYENSINNDENFLGEKSSRILPFFTFMTNI